VSAQTRRGGEGSGFVVHDVAGTPEAVWSLLTDFGRYDQIIGTVRASTVQPGSTATRARTTFVLSRFLLEVSVLHLFFPHRHHLTFSLDRGSTNRVLRQADGWWFVQEPSGGLGNDLTPSSGSLTPGLKPGHVRIWFGASVTVSRLVPDFVVTYIATRALARATAWLRPAVDQRTARLKQRVRSSL
jgi:hypothetical protein